MVLLSLFPAWSRIPLLQGMLDASLLTLVMAPIIWWLVVKPLRRLSESRGHLLHSRDLHDEIGQQLTALLVGLGTVESAKDLQTAQQLAQDLRKVGGTAHEEVRRLARGLRPGVLEELGLFAAIERLCEDFEQVHGVNVRLKLSAAASGQLSLPVEISLYRILQESLTNVARHAHANSVNVTLIRARDMVTLTVEDDGCGMHDTSYGLSAPGQRSLGLDSIRERALMLQGECTICNAQGGGLLVHVTLPALK